MRNGIRFTLALVLVVTAWCAIAQDAVIQKAIPQVGSDTVIRVLYAGAKDCPPCIEWKGPMGGREKFLETEEGKATEVVYIERRFIKNNFEASDRPEPFRQYWLTSPSGTFNGLPVFGVLIDDDLILTARGNSGWDDKIVPMVKRIYAERELRRDRSGN